MTTSRRHPTWILFAAVVALGASWAQHGRADAPVGRYTIANGIVTDTKTLLTWQQTISASSYTWSNAQSYCTGLNLNGTGWRVPSMKELQTIVDETKTNPSIDPTAFPSTPVDVFWTSSPLAGSPSNAWYVYFKYGSFNFVVVTDTYRVRCVR